MNLIEKTNMKRKAQVKVLDQVLAGLNPDTTTTATYHVLQDIKAGVVKSLDESSTEYGGNKEVSNA